MQRLAEALADQVPIDWEEVLAAHPERKRELWNLQKLQALTRSFSGRRWDESGSSDSPKESEIPQTTAACETDDEASPERWGHFILERRIGEGAFAEVFLAYDPKLDTRFALKLLKPDLIAQHGERFISEARRLRQVQHTHIVTIHGVDEHDGRPGLWMDYLEGPNLEHRLEQGVLSWREAAAIGLELCGALAAIHGAGLVHGDVKPANIMCSDGGKRHVLTDFGAAGMASPTTLLQSSLCGTPMNMAPEVFLQGVRNSPASDIYSLGVLLYLLVCGQYPVEAKTCEELAEKLARGHTIPLVDRCPDLPPNFLRIVNRALAFDRTKRQPSVGHMERELANLFSPAGLLERSRRWARTHPRFLMLASATLLVVVGALLLWKVPLRVHAGLYRLQDDGSQFLAPETVIHPGDQLRLAYEGSHESFVYVFDEATQELGKINTLFPLAAGGFQNPLHAGTRYILPSQDWVLGVDETGGTERILIIVSKYPLQGLTDQLRGIHPQPYLSVADDGDGEPQSQLDRIVRQLGEPSWSLWWRVFELECEPLQDEVLPGGN